MTDKAERILAPMREICGNLIKNNNSNDNYVEQLLELSKKSQFHSYNIVKILLDLLENNYELEKSKIDDIFTIINALFIKDAVLQKSILISHYNFLIKRKWDKKSDDYLLDKIFEFTTPKDTLTTSETLNTYMELTNNWTSVKKVIQDKKKRDVINSNYRLFIKSITTAKNDQKTLFQRLSNICNYYFKEGPQIVVNFLKNIVLEAFKVSTMQIESEEVFIEYMNFIQTVVFYRNTEWNKALCIIIPKVEKFFTEPEHISLNKILHKSIDVFSTDPINADSINEIYTVYFQNPQFSPKSVLQHKATQIITILFKTYAESLELSESCLLACHEFIFKLFNIAKYVKDKSEPFQKCCTDIKRHIIFRLALIMIYYANKLLASDIFTKKIEKYLQYHVDYSLVLYKDISCGSKNILYNDLSSILHCLVQNLCIKSSNVNVIAQVYKAYVILVGQQKGENEKENFESLLKAGVMLVNVSFGTSSETALIYADTIIHPILFAMKTNSRNYLSKLVYKLHETLKLLDYDCVYDYVRKKSENSEIAKYAKDIDLEEFNVLEIEAVFRYDSKNIEDLSRLFQKIYKTKNTDYLVRACLSINDRVLKKIDLVEFKDLNARLEDENFRSKDIKIMNALVSNYYYIRVIEEDDLETQIKSKDVLSDIPDCLTLENEVKIVKYLDKSLEYLQEILLRIKENPKDMEKLASCRILCFMMENLSTEYFVRGISNKDLEMKLIMWHFLEYQDNQEQLIDTAAFFLDNYHRLIGKSGHYVCISKKFNYLRIEDIIPKANKALENLLENIHEKSENKQIRPLNYMLSLWSYYMLTGRRTDAFEVLERYEKIRDVCKLESHFYQCIIEAKKHVAIAEINLKCFKKNTVDHLYRAVMILQMIRTIHADYTNIFQFLFRSLILKVINYSLNRMVDIENFTTAMLTITNQAIKRGLYVKTLELFSLSVLRNLNMERLDDAKADLKKMSKMLRLDDDILVEIPISMKQTIPLASFENHDLTVRKAIPNNSSPTSRIEVFNSATNNTDDLIEQLQNFVHEYTCKCPLCQYPQLKFILFQMGCHYSRLLFMMTKVDVSKSFNEHALDPWRFSCVKILRSKECESFSINKADFIIFSIRWLFQAADTFVRTKSYDSAEEVYTEIELLCTKDIEDYECINQNLQARMQNLEFLMKYESQLEQNENRKELDFNEFLKNRITKPSPTASKLTPSSSKPLNPTPPTSKSTKPTPPALKPTKSTSKSESKKTLAKSATTIPALTRLKLPTTSNHQNLVESVIFIDSEEEEKPKKAAVKATAKVTRATRTQIKSQVDLTSTTKEGPKGRIKRCI